MDGSRVLRRSTREGSVFRIRLMLVCAHPAIDPKIRSALMLQTVLGLEAKAMASAFLVSAESI
jgi:RNA polymerase sigma-70 factor (ECF subfamily)